MCLAVGGVPALAQEAVEEAPAGVTIVTGTEWCGDRDTNMWTDDALGRLHPRGCRHV